MTKKNHSEIKIVSMIFVFVCFSMANVFAKKLFFESFEDKAGIIPAVYNAGERYPDNKSCVTDEQAKTGKYSLKLENTSRNDFYVYAYPLLPDTIKPEKILSGHRGRAGTFIMPGLLNLSLDKNKAYILSCQVKVDKMGNIRGSAVNVSLLFKIKTKSKMLYKGVRIKTFVEPGKDWVKIEFDVANVLRSLDAEGYDVNSIALDAICLGSYSWAKGPKDHKIVYIDDISVEETDRDKIPAALKSKRIADYSFKSMPEAENSFVWGVYSNSLQFSGWDRFYKPAGSFNQRMEQKLSVSEKYGDWWLLDQKRHYCNITHDGTRLIPKAPPVMYKILKTVFDKYQQYNLKVMPQINVSQHYRRNATKEECLKTMRKYADMFEKHPALFANFLVDEPGNDFEDFFWGKDALEKIDSRHPSLGIANSIKAVETYAPYVNILPIDRYSISYGNKDKGCWAIPGAVRYARELGAKRVWVVAHFWSGGNNWRFPAEAEAKVQIFYSLAEGATGFLPYSPATMHQWGKPVRNGYYHRGFIDPFGNPTYCWDIMKKFGLQIRSSMALVLKADRLKDSILKLDTAGERYVSSPTGKKYPVVYAGVYSDRKNGANYAVICNNSLKNDHQITVTIPPDLDKGAVVDLFTLKDVPVNNGTFKTDIKAAEGTIFAFVAPDKKDYIKNEIYKERYAIEADLMEVELRVADRVSTQSSEVKKLCQEAEKLNEKKQYKAAYAKIVEAKKLLVLKTRENTLYTTVDSQIQECRKILGGIHELLQEKVFQRKFSKNPAKRTKAQTQLVDKINEIALRFFDLNNKLIQSGPAKIKDKVDVLLKDLKKIEKTVPSAVK